MQKFQTADDGIDPIEYVKAYFTHLTPKEISVLVGSIALLEKVEYEVLESVLELEQMEVEEKIGRLMQTDLLDGKFHKDHFELIKFNYNIKKQHPNLTLDDRSILAYIKARYEVTLRELQQAFDLSYASTIFILAGYVAKGLLTPENRDEETFRFVIHFHYDKKSASEVTDLEKQLVGYFQILGRSTMSQVALDLEEPEHKILSTLTTLILSDMITVTFETETGLFSGFKLYIVIDRFQVFFEQRSIQVLSNVERNYLGYLSLRRSAKIKEIAIVLEISESQVIKVAAMLHATNQFKIEKSGAIFTVQKYRPLSINRSLEVLTQIHSFNYRFMIGILQTQQKISIKDLAQKMDIDDREVIDGLISCYIEGLIDGYLDDRHVFTLKAVRQSSNPSEVTLERWERIIMGALISEQTLAWPKIAALLEVDRIDARNRAFEFISRRISRTTAKETVIVLEKDPSLPPLVQIDSLKPIEQEIFGYLKSSTSPNIKELGSIFKLSNIEVLRFVYFLAGSGLYSLKRNKNQLLVTNIVKYEPKLSTSELDMLLQQIIRYIEIDGVDEIDLREMSKQLELNRYHLLKLLFRIIAMGYYEGTIKGRTFKLKSSLIAHFDAGICLYCSDPLEAGLGHCTSCNKPLPNCGVCKGNLNSNEQLLACPHCKNLNHANHIKQWLQIKGECPFCRNKLQISQLLIQQPLL